MGEFGHGMMEFEFDENSGTFQPTVKVAAYIRQAVMKGDFTTAVHFYTSAQEGVGKFLYEEAVTGSEAFQANLAKMFELARDFDLAARLYSLRGDVAKAGDLFEQDYHFDAAAEAYERGGLYSKAALAYERAMNWEKAAKMHYMRRDMDKSAHCLVRGGRAFEAGELLMKHNAAHKAAKAYRQVKPDHPRFLEAMLKLADILFTSDNRDAAMKLYFSIVGRFDCKPETLQAYYRLALGYEEYGNKEAADGLLRNVIALDPGYEDAKDRLEGKVSREVAPEPKEEDLEELQAEPEERIADPEKDGVMNRLRLGFEHLHGYPLMKKLTLKDVQLLYDISEIESFKPGTIIIRESDELQKMYILLHGSVDILKATDEGGTITVANLGPGQAVGELSVVTGAPATATVRAAEIITCLKIERDTLFAFLHEDVRRMAQVYESLVESLTGRLEEANRKMAGR